MRIAFACYLLAALLLASAGVLYLLRSEFMPYHAEALGRPWAGLERPFQILIRALMTALGGTSLATAIAMTILLVKPFREDAAWARYAIPAIGLTAALPGLYAMLSVARLTPASPPLRGGVLVVFCLFLGFVLSVLRVSKSPKDQMSPQ